MRSRCFSKPKRAITTSSDRTQAKKDVTIYKGLRALRSHGIAHPQRGVHITRCATAGGDIKRKLVAVESYDLLDSIVRGKYYSHPVLEGAAPEAHYESWGAALQSQEYDTKLYPAPVSGYSGPPTDCSPVSCTWTDPGYPYYTIDHPTGLSGGGGVLAERCAPPPGAKRVSPWNAQAKIAFRNSNAYWTAVNAQPLQGMELRAPLHFTNVDPAPACTQEWGPTQSDPTMNSGVLFCQGKSSIN